MSVIYKLFIGVMAKRPTRWSIDAGAISDEQKSVRPPEGCYEHTYLLKSLVADSRRRKQKLFLTWLDIRNALGSVPHATIRLVLRHIGVPSDLVTLIHVQRLSFVPRKVIPLLSLFVLVLNRVVLLVQFCLTFVLS